MPAFGFGPQQYQPTAPTPGVDPNVSGQGYQQRLTSQQNYQQNQQMQGQQFGYNQQLQNAALANALQLQGMSNTEQTGLANINTQSAQRIAQMGNLSQQQIASGQEQSAQKISAGQVAGQENVAQTQAEASKYPATLQQQRFQSIFPYLTNSLQASQQGIQGLNNPANTSGQPGISAAPVYSPNQIQQQVNLQNAGTNQNTQTQQAAMNSSLAGRGYGANSPLAQALGVGMQQGGLATNTGNETNLRSNAAQMNSAQVLKGQQAQEGQYASRQQEAIQRAQVAQQALSAALGSLSGAI